MPQFENTKHMQELNPDDFADTALLPADTTITPTLLKIIRSETFDDFINELTPSDQQWLNRQSFAGKTGQIAWLENGQGIIGSSGEDSLSTLGHLPYQLPEGRLSSDRRRFVYRPAGLGPRRLPF
jgi:hypothetical protein